MAYNVDNKKCMGIESSNLSHALKQIKGTTAQFGTKPSINFYGVLQLINFKTMKRYTVIDNKTGYKNDFSWLEWNIAWGLIFILGMMTGAILF